MSGWLWVVLGVGAALAITIAVLWRPIRSAMRATEYERLRKDFHRQRERLEARFFQLASNSGRPRGLRWTNCDFEDDVAYARNRRSGDLSAFVAVTIAFEAIEGGLMEDVEAVGNLRAATAVFNVDNGRWQTEGRAIYNLNPTEAIAHFRDNLEIVAQELAHRS